MIKMVRILKKLKERLYQDDIKQFYEESSTLVCAKDSVGKNTLSRAIIMGGIGVASLFGFRVRKIY